MSDYIVMKPVELSATCAAFRKKYPTYQSLVDAGYWLQRKYDGCCGVAVFAPGQPAKMLSRTGEDYSVSCRLILEQLEDKLGGQACVVIGEVWHPSWDFPKISGRFRQQREAEPELTFRAFDMLPWTAYVNGVWNEPYSLRFRSMVDQGLPVVDTKPGLLGLPSTIDLAVKWKLEGGYDGAVLRDPNAGYICADAKLGQAIKVKPVMSLDLRVTAVSVEKRPTKLGGYLTVQLPDGQYNDVGSGLTQAHLTGFLTELEARLWVNQIAEIEFMGYQPDGKLREPRFKGLRFDKTKPD